MGNWKKGLSTESMEIIREQLKTAMEATMLRITDSHVPRPFGIVTIVDGNRDEFDLDYLDDPWRSLPVEAFEQRVHEYADKAILACLVGDMHGMGKPAIGVQIATRSGVHVDIIQRYVPKADGTVEWRGIYPDHGTLGLWRD